MDRKRLPALDSLLLVAAVVLGGLWISEIRSSALCPAPFDCPAGPYPECTVSERWYTGGSVGTWCQGQIADCLWYICWYEDSAGLCYNADYSECFYWP
jgi:hypothetical protein